MKELKFELKCGAFVTIQQSGPGFYFTVDQRDGTPWYSDGEVDEDLRTSHIGGLRYKGHYIKGYLSGRSDLAQAFREVANFIDENIKSIPPWSKGENYE
jgi:hypothetical protein